MAARDGLTSPSMNDVSLEASTRSPWWVRALPPLFSVVGSSLAVVFALQLWRAHAGVPLQYGGDSLSHAMHLEQIASNGWIWNDDRLAAPFVQHMQDWPIGDILSLVTAWVLALFTSNWAAIQNGMFLVSFPLTALSAWWAMRKLGVNSWTASVLGILFSLLPYHFVRGESHLFLSNYYVVPLGVYLAVRLLDPDSLFAAGTRFRSRWLHYLSWRSVQTVLIAVVVGLGGIYYAAFTLIFVGIAFVARVLRRRSVLPPVVIGAVLVAVVAVITLPTMLYQAENGANTKAAVRNAYESDVYGLKLAQMLAPAPGHRIDAFDDYQRKYLDEFPLPGERGSAALGVVASFGLLTMLGLALASLLRPPAGTFGETRMRQFSLFALCGFLVAAVGGLSTPIGLLIIDDIRSWNRMSVFIGLCALAVVGLLIDALVRRFRSRRTPLFAALLASVLLVGYFDQVTPMWTPAYAAVDAKFLEDQKYFGALEDTVGEGASVFILPQVEFPEAAPVNGVTSNDEVIPYLHTDTIKWSFGGIKGRLESAWQSRIRQDSAADLATDLAVAGFRGVLIDRRGYDDNAVVLEADLQSVLGGSVPIENAGKYYAFYDLASYAETLDVAVVAERKNALLYAAGVVNLVDFSEMESDENGSWNWAVGDRGNVVLDNTARRALRSEVVMQLETATDAPSQFFITWPDGSSQTVQAGAEPVTISHTSELKRGQSQVVVRTDAAALPAEVDARELRFRLLAADVREAK
jgi:MFS family permease